MIISNSGNLSSGKRCEILPPDKQIKNIIFKQNPGSRIDQNENMPLVETCRNTSIYTHWSQSVIFILASRDVGLPGFMM